MIDVRKLIVARARRDQGRARIGKADETEIQSQLRVNLLTPNSVVKSLSDCCELTSVPFERAGLV